MNVRGFQSLLFIACLGFFARLCPAAFYADGRARFLQALPSLMQTNKQPIVVTFESVGRAAGRTVAGYDQGTGAWFMARQGGCAGRTPTGAFFRADLDDPGPVERPPAFAELLAVAEHIPWAYLGAFQESPESVLHAELRDGVWEVIYQPLPPGIDHASPDRLLRIDAATGRVLSRERVSSELARVEFIWDDSPLGYLPHEPGFFTQERTDLDLDADLGLFRPQRVYQAMKEARILVDRKLQGISTGYVEQPDGSWAFPDAQTQSVQAFDDPFTSRYRAPLIAGGVLVLGIAAVHIVRRRVCR